MRLVPEIREQLLDAAFGAAEPRPGRGRRPRSGALAIASSIVVTVVVAAVFLLSLHGSQAPPSGAAVGPKSGPPAPASGATPVAWVNALGKAGSSTRQHDRACRLPLKVRVRSQRFLTSAPPRSITSILPSLATPARGAVRVTIRELRALHIEATGIYARYAWQGRADGGGGVILEQRGALSARQREAAAADDAVRAQRVICEPPTTASSPFPKRTSPFCPPS